MLKKSCALLAASLLLAASSRSFGWGHEGHAIVAKIAEMRLTPAAREGVADLLGDTSMSDIASWPDEIRHDRPETGPWHYVDIPDDQETYDAARDGRNGANVIDKITEFANAVNDQSLTKKQRTEALKFLIHFCGDITQPLHCSERDHDKGGNGRQLYLLDQPRATNLHGVWDYGILEHMMGNTPITVYASALNIRITPAQAREWRSGTPESWANESHKLAHNIAYDGVPTKPSPLPKLDQAYVDRAIPVINMQLQKGGVRLASILNKAFHDTDAASRPLTAVTQPFENEPAQSSPSSTSSSSSRSRRQPATAPAAAPKP